MVLNNLKQVMLHFRRQLPNKIIRFYSLYEPPYLKQDELHIKDCPVLNIQLRGYEYPLLEKYQSFITKLAKVLDITVDDSFAFPHREYNINRFKKGSTLVDAEYKLKIFERDMQISNLSVVKYPILLRILEATLPEGVSLHIDKYDPILQKKRLIPNRELIDVKSELSELTANKSK